MPNSTGAKVLTRLGQFFFNEVPVQYSTYCALNSLIACSVLKKFGHQGEVLPCQLGLALPKQLHLFGFIDPPPQGQWNGHAICVSDGHLIDLAVSHCKKIFDDAPKVVVAPLFPKFSAAISRVTLDSTANIALWWLPPPSGYDTTIPEEPINIVQQFAERLYRRLSSA